MELIVLATTNRDEVREFQELLGDGYQVASLTDVGFTGELEEGTKTFRGNAQLKVKAAREYLDSIGRPYVVLAESSGLCVTALHGQPGLKTAQFGGEELDDQGKRDLLREKLADEEDRSAMYKCVLILTLADGRSYVEEGETHGAIIDEERGEYGFAFDSIFYSNDLQKTFGEATSEEKNEVSHRARALKKIMAHLKN